MMKKRFIPVFVAVLMMFSMMPMMSGGAYADDIGIVYEGLSYTLHDNYYLVFNGVEDENAEGIDRTTGELTIHTSYHGSLVKKIGTNVFKEKLPSGIHKVILPIGLEEIKEYAFFKCSGLTSISFPQCVSMIGQRAFQYCQDLETVSFEEEGDTCHICSDAFSGCLNLKEVTIPKRVIQIDGGAFEDCDALTTVHYSGTREQWEAIRGSGKPSIDLVDFCDTSVSHTHQGTESEQGINFQPWRCIYSLPDTAGDYCLTQDVTLSDAWIAPGGTTRLCLNGHSIIRSGNGLNESDPAVIRVEKERNEDNTTLCLYDCGTKEHTFSIAENNPAIVDPSSGTATGTFTGGYITSKDANISGVRVEGTFEMNGGTIIGNKNSGVRVHNSGRFNLHSGDIIGNTADIGGGVRLIGGSSSHTAFEMTGGKISHNTANGVSNTAHGGGVFMQRADFSMSGGIVTNNSVINEKGAICGGGVCSLDDVDTDRNVISIGNNPVIKDNTVVGTNGTAPSNLSLLQNSNITSDFTNKINILSTNGVLSGTIGVTYGSTDGKGVFTTHMGGLLAADKLAGDIFFSDNEELGVIGLKHDGHFVAELIDKTAAPNFSPAGGKYNAAQNVTLSCATEGARIYYTTDGTEPSKFSTEYSTPIVVSSTTTIKAIAEKGGMLLSDVADATYKFPYRVVFDPGDGGSGDMNPQEVYDGDMFTFPECGFTATEGKTFYYWEMSGVDGMINPRAEVEITGNCLDTGDVITVTAHWKDNAIITNAPTANDLTYNGADQQLVSEGTAQGGVMYYAIGNDNTTAPTSGWSESIPRKTKADIYYVWYKAVGDSSHSNSDAKCCKAEIKRASPDLTMKADPITYGQTLADSTLSGSEAKASGKFVEGTFSWIDDTIKPAVSDSEKTKYDVTFTPSDTVNYKTAAGTATLTVNKANITPSVSIEGWTYGSSANKPTVTGNTGGGKETFLYKKTDEPDSAYTQTVPTDAGDHTIKAEIAETDNYNAGQATQNFTISKASITIKADDKSSKYGKALKKLTYKVSGAYVKGDDLGVKLSTAAKKNKAGTTAIKVSWNNNPNYEAKLVNGKYTVGRKPQPKINKAAAKIALDAGVVARSSGNKVTAGWGKVKGASSYVIYANYCDQKNCKKIRTVSGKTTSINITKVNGKKFNPKKNLKFYVVAYKTVKGKKVKLAKSITAHAPGSKNSKRTNVTGVTVKKAAFTLKKGKTAKIKAKLVLEKKNRKPLNHEAKFRYASSNKKVAKVSKKGKITAVGKGKCTVYVYAVSGVSKKIKVTVR